MFQTIKQGFYELVKKLGYNVSDNGTYRNQFPWLMIRTAGASSMKALHVRIDSYSLALDIFSTYNGEQEILNIVERINGELPNMMTQFPQIQFVELSTFKILNDKETGPVRKHGVAVFRFTLSGNYQEVSDNESTNE